MPVPVVAAGTERLPPSAPSGKRPAGALDGGLALGTLAVVAFSLTLPATRIAVPTLGVAFVGLGRAVGAAVVAGIYLALTRSGLPSRRDVGALFMIALGVIFGFPIMAALAMNRVPAAHGAVITGLIPCATAAMGVWRAGERPPRSFWWACAAGVVSVLIFAAAEGAGRPQTADVFLLLGVIGAALGYAEGARLSREWGEGSGIRVISWVLVLASPFALATLVIWSVLSPQPPFTTAGAAAWTGFAYLTLVSAYLAFFPWYAGLARGGVARVGQVQLIQPVLSVAWAVVLLGEPLRARTVLAALLVIASAGTSVLMRRRGQGTSPGDVSFQALETPGTP